MTTIVRAHPIGNGPYLSTDRTVDMALVPPTPVNYWNGTSYVTKYRYGSVKPGSIMGLVSISGIPGLDIELAQLRVMTVESVVPCPSSVSWYSKFIFDANFLYTPFTGVGNGESSTASLGRSGSRVTFTQPLGRAVKGHGASTDATFDYMVELEQTGATGTEQGLAFFGQSVITAAVSAGATSLPIRSSFAQFIPVSSDGTYPTVSASLLGADASPFVATGGRVSIFRPDEAAVIHHTASLAPQTVANAQSVNCGRTRLAKVRVFGNDGLEIKTGFTANLTAGTVLFSNVAGYSQPVTIQHRIEDMVLVSEALEQSLKMGRGITHDYPLNAKVSSVMMLGDMQARVHDGWDQETWTGVWSEARIGNNTTAEYNEAAHPIVVSNAGAITERWAVVFTSSTQFRVIGEQVGEVIAAGQGSTATNTAPVNPATGAPYFTIPATGWGTGWSIGNTYRFNTDGANAPVWLIRSIAPSDPFVGQDKFTVAIRGNVNA